jgi:prephenate dehydrogenase
VFVCATSQSDAAAIAATNALWSGVGAHVVAVDAETHDRNIAWISHLPQLTANSLALALKAGGLPHESLGPGGRDMTRLAGSNAEVWQGVLRANGDMIDEPLACMIDALSELRAVLRRGDASSLVGALRASQSWFNTA